LGSSDLVLVSRYSTEAAFAVTITAAGDGKRPGCRAGRAATSTRARSAKQAIAMPRISVLAVVGDANRQDGTAESVPRQPTTFAEMLRKS